MHKNGFVFFVSSFALGVATCSFVHVGFLFSLSFLFLAFLFILYGIFISPRIRKTLFLLSFVLAAFIGGVARYELSEPGKLLLAEYVGERVNAEGIISREIDTRDSLSFLTVDLDSVSTSKGKDLISERIRVAVDPFLEFAYGDRISFSGVVQEPENFETDTGRVFDYKSYLAKDGIYHEMYRPSIELIDHGEGNPIVSVLLSFKSAFMSHVERVVPEPESALLGGLVLGEKHSLGEELTEDFRRAGLVHIIVLSGYNMTIVARAITAFLSWFGSFLPVFVPPLAGVLGIIAFTIMAGASATAVRAALMALLVILAGVTHRDYDIKRALALAGFVMIAHNPKILAFDPSFQLSFLATIGLIYLSPFFERWFAKITNRFGFREIISATLSTQAFVLPRLIALSGTVSVVGIFANILVLPIIPLTMLFGALTGLLGFLHEIIAIPFSYISYTLLHYQVLIAHWFGSFSFSAISVPTLPIFVVLALYAVLIWAVYRLHKKT